MRFKRITAALLTGILMSFSMVGTAFAYTGETEAAESTAASETEIIEVKDEKEEKPAKDTSEAEVPYEVTVSKDGTYTFTLGDYEWSFNPDQVKEAEQIGTVTNLSSYLHLRTGAGMEYEIIGHLLPGTQVKVVGKDGEWYKVVVPEQSGYVHSNYLSVVEKAVDSGEVNEEILAVLLSMMCQSQQQVSEGHGLTPPGNLTMVDDIGSATGAGQQFITLVSKNGNIFYMVIDRDDDGNENVHFMNLVDEADLFALLDEDSQAAFNAENKEPIVTEPEKTKPDEEPEITEPQPDEEPAKKSNWAPLMLLAIIGIGGVGFAGYSFMNKKKKAQESGRPDPDADYQDEDEEEYDIPEDEDSVEDDDNYADDEDIYSEAYNPDGEE